MHIYIYVRRYLHMNEKRMPIYFAVYVRELMNDTEEQIHSGCVTSVAWHVANEYARCITLILEAKTREKKEKIKMCFDISSAT
jgi:hypothetical protein